MEDAKLKRAILSTRVVKEVQVRKHLEGKSILKKRKGGRFIATLNFKLK